MRRLAVLAAMGLVIAAAPPAANAFTTNGSWESAHTKLYIGNLSYWWASELARAANDWNKKTDFSFHLLGDGNPACDRYKSGVLIYPFSDQQPLMNGVEFNDSYCGQIPFEPGVLAVTQWLTDDDGFFSVAGLVFNDFYTWEVFHGPVGETTIDFHRVALHELGHFLGLGHETTNPAIMQPVISDLDELQQDDIDGAQSLYATTPPPPSPILAPETLCRTHQLKAAAKYCKRQLACESNHAKDAARDAASRDACLGTASGVRGDVGRGARRRRGRVQGDRRGDFDGADGRGGGRRRRPAGGSRQRRRSRRSRAACEADEGGRGPLQRGLRRVAEGGCVVRLREAHAPPRQGARPLRGFRREGDLEGGGERRQLRRRDAGRRRGSARDGREHARRLDGALSAAGGSGRLRRAALAQLHLLREHVERARRRDHEAGPAVEEAALPDVALEELRRRVDRASSSEKRRPSFSNSPPRPPRSGRACAAAARSPGR